MIFSSKDCSVWDFTITLGCFTFIFSKNEGNRLRIVKKIQIFDRAKTRRTRPSFLIQKRHDRKHFGCP